MTKAYSYLRFSTPEQMQGDSFRRQTALAQAYAQQNGLDLDTSLTFHDLGVSAFRGRNAGAEGQLGAFLEAIRRGIVPEGSYLLVESLDRISRQTARKALRSLEDVVEAGAIVVTLIDGRKYDKDSLDSDPMALLLSILTFMRAHEESATKASRLKAAWSEKREQAAKSKKPMTRACPAWLDLDYKTGVFTPIRERVEVVQRIFAMTLEGVGQGVIAQTLNREGVPPFRGAKHWHRTYIAKILDNPAVLGTFVPHVQDHSTGKRVRRALDPIQGYFPAIIAPETVQQLQAMRSGTVQPRRGRHAGKPLNNLFGGLGRCSDCGSTMTMTNKGDGNKYFICTRAKAGAGCTYRAIPYQQIEDCFLSVWPELLEQAPSATDEEQLIKSHLQEALLEKQWLSRTIENTLQAIEGRTSVPAALLDRIAQLEHKRTKLVQEEQALYLRQQSLANSMIAHRLAALRSLLGEQPLDKAKVNAVLRQLFGAVQIDREAGVLTFQWQQDGYKTPVRYTGTEARRVQKRLQMPVPRPVKMPEPIFPPDSGELPA